MSSSENIYLPYTAQITRIKQETPDVKTLSLRFTDEAVAKNFSYKPGQFVEFSVLGEGESTFCISNSPTRSGTSIECSIKQMGKVTQAIHELDIGDIVGIRGPYGNGFPIENLKGKNLLFVAGGIGLAPLRSLINYCLDMRSDFKTLTIVNGARSSKDLVYKDEYENWKKQKYTKK